MPAGCTETGAKVCPTCKQTLTLLDFCKDTQRKDGLSYQCRGCVAAYGKQWHEKNREKINARARERYKHDPVPRRNERLKRVYGLSPETWDYKFQIQGRVCKICGTDTPGGHKNSWHIDHNHSTGKIRGILCYRCNVTLGLVQDNPDLLASMAGYLKEKPMLMGDYIKSQLCLVAWREERSNGLSGQLGVMFVIRNRVHAGWFEGDWAKNITGHNQFSSMSVKGDAGTVSYPDVRDPLFLELLQQVDGVYDNTTNDSITGGALYYADMGSPGYQKGGWFARVIAADSKNHPIVAKVGSTTYFK